MVGRETKSMGEDIMKLEPNWTQNNLLKTMIRVKPNAEVFIRKKHDIKEKLSVMSLIKKFEVMS